jgi:hypothetical protein
MLRRAVCPGNDQHNRAVIRVRRGCYVPVLTDAVLTVVLFDVEPIALVVRKNESSVVKRDLVFFQVLSNVVIRWELSSA